MQYLPLFLPLVFLTLVRNDWSIKRHLDKKSVKPFLLILKQADRLTILRRVSFRVLISSIHVKCVDLRIQLNGSRNGLTHTGNKKLSSAPRTSLYVFNYSKNLELLEIKNRVAHLFSYFCFGHFFISAIGIDPIGSCP